MTEHDHDSQSDIAHGLMLFRTFDWEQAYPLLRQLAVAGEQDESVLAALGICTFFATNSPAVTDENLPPLADLLAQGVHTEWAVEAAACQVGLELIQTDDPSDESLNQLIASATASSWYPVWALALHTLSHFDRRQQLGELVNTLSIRLPDLGPVHRLVLAEAQLESAHAAGPLNDRVLDGNNDQIGPLSPSIINLWQTWLTFEQARWQPGENVISPEMLFDALAQPPSDCKSYDFQVYRRLRHCAGLSGGLHALTTGNLDDAIQWLNVAVNGEEVNWEDAYLQGLIKWAEGDLAEAQNKLAQSLVLNPHQSRVRFEADLCAGTMPQAVPQVADMLVSAAKLALKAGEPETAQVYLNQLAQPEEAYSQRLISPRAREQRLSQEIGLRVHLAEQLQGYAGARNVWENGYPSTVAMPPTHRAHWLYTLERCLATDQADDPDPKLEVLFNKELGKLSIRSLRGQALFYRALAAQATMPEQSIADWQALSGQPEWWSWAAQTAPEELLQLGDALVAQGETDTALQVYALACDAGVATAEERHALCTLAATGDEATRQESLDRLHKLLPDDPRWPFWHGLLMLAQIPPNLEGADSALVATCAAGLPEHLAELGQHLLALAANDLGAPDRLSDWKVGLTSEQQSVLSDALWAGIALLCDPANPETRREFARVYGDDWIIHCPFDPGNLWGYQVWMLSNQSKQPERYKQALALLDEAEALNADVPLTWRVLLHTLQAIEVAIYGDFNEADEQYTVARKLIDETADHNS